MANWEKIRVIRNKEDMQVGQIVPRKHYRVLETSNEDGFNPDFQVTFRITEACDLKCNYCHWHSGAHYKYEDIIQCIDKLFEYFVKQGFRRVLFYYHGGEPTRHPRVVDILKYIHERSAATGIQAYNEMQTNLTVSADKLRAILKYCDRFNVSFHYLELAVKNKLASFDRNWDLLAELGIKLHNFDIMMENVERNNRFYIDRIVTIDPDDFYSRVIEYLKYPNIINSEMIYGFCHYEYPEEVAERHREFYKKHNRTEQKYDIDDKIYTTNDLFKLGIDARGSRCGAGRESITINGDGNVFHCGIHMTNFIRQCGQEIPYTNLLTDAVALAKMSILYKTGTICRWDYCGGDFYLSRTPPQQNNKSND